MVDLEQTSPYGLEWAHALIATRNGKTTDRGNSLVVDFNDDGDLVYKMVHDPNKEKEGIEPIKGLPFGGAEYSVDEPLTLSPNQINDLLVLKDNDKNG